MFSLEIFGAWVAVLLTLCILSFLYADNPFYKAAEHLYIGLSAGYALVMAFWTGVRPNLFGRLWPDVSGQTDDSILQTLWYYVYEFLNLITTCFGLFERSIFPEGGIPDYNEIKLIYLIPFILGIFMLLRLVPKVSWLARWAIAYIVGMAAGLRFYGYLSSDIIVQIQAATIDFTSDWMGIINGLVLFVGTITGLIYFFFSKEHKGYIGTLSKIGIYFLMIKFGASFGYAVMGRISLLIGRIDELKQFSTSEYHFATPILALLIIVCLAIWSFTSKEKSQEEPI